MKKGAIISIHILLFVFGNCDNIFSQFITNPILAGFYPDPSICRVGADYYIVNSSFAYYPSLPIFHSKDLVNWEQIGAVLDRPEQLNLDSAGVSRGLFAPTIRYHKGLYYVICTLVDKGGNFIVTATNPKGPWSNPAWLPEIDGIDPSIFFDDDDKAYILYNSIPPNNISMHDGHRTIRMNALDAKTLKVIGENKIIINGGTDMAKKPVWIEGPHLIKKDGWYYLICAEGGTSDQHSEVVFRSKKIDADFVSYEKNPILTQRNLNANRENAITNTGHADFVETKDGKWWAVFLGCRPYEQNYFNTGRETFMAPVEWKDDWPIINLGAETVQYTYPIDAKINAAADKFSGNYFFKDQFSNAILNKRYNFLRTVKEKWYRIDNGVLEMQVRPQTCSGFDNPSFIGFRQTHLNGYAATEQIFAATNKNEKAGLIVFQNEEHYYYLCQSIENGKPVVQLYKANELLASESISFKNIKAVQLKIKAEGNTYSFYFATEKNKWKLLKNKIDAKFLSTQVAGGFVGSLYGLYATSNGMPCTNKVLYNWFENKNDDAIYKK
jgi:xylan 1,4-beta-xylosidase